ncbi:glycosyltransferase WbuB [Desulfonema ishimotonii]|uniref:Glycosyltransferase WbuB n=2 Tax=Desulfonema ishimotonii TaxID=45657 RepID=A0A401G3D4_9BACT|nr:glycosyltransferase WbuB [Desulfonema ishimotonii]
MIKIAMVVFSYYPADPRVRREAEALVEAGMSVDVICLKGIGESQREDINGVNAYRINLMRTRAGKLRYLFEYSYFIISAFLMLSCLHLLKQYRIIHIHNMPDILVISAILPKLTGSKLILDLHDPMPEVYLAKYPDAPNSVIKILKTVEKFSIGFADLVITPNISFRNLFVSRSCPSWKIHIVMNSPQENIFQKNKPERNKKAAQSKFSIMYHGSIVERHGLDIAIRMMTHLRKKISNLVLHVYGDGNFLNQIKKNVRDMDLRDIVKFHGAVPLETIAKAIASADVGLIPNRMDPFTNLNFPTRIFEYLIIGKPVIVPRTQGIRDYFDEKSLFFFEAENTNDLSEVVLKVYHNPTQRQEVTNRGIDIYAGYRWKLQRKHLIELIKTQCC